MSTLFPYQDYLQLKHGDSESGKICPFCNGGNNNDKSFSVTRLADGNIVYLCHRAKCGKSGVYRQDGSAILAIATKTKEHKVFDEPIADLSAEVVEFFNKVYGLTRAEVVVKGGFKWVPGREAVLHPIFAPDRIRRGEVVRRYSDKRIWSYKRFKDDRSPFIGWFQGPRGAESNDVVIVEDILSALKLSRFHNAVCLNSTHISREAVLELLRWSRKQYLCLDKDATKVAHDQADRWNRTGLLNVQVVECLTDPKYWTDEKLEKLRGT